MLGIVGLVIGGIWAGAAEVTQNHRINDVATALIRTIAGTRQLLKGNFGALCEQLSCGINKNITPVLQKAGVTPGNYPLTTITPLPGWMSDPSAVATPLGAPMAVTIGDWSVHGSGVEIALSVILFGLDKASCIKLISAVSGRFRDNTDLIFIETDLLANGDDAKTFPMPVSVSATICAPKSSSNYLIFYFNPL